MALLAMEGFDNDRIPYGVSTAFVSGETPAAQFTTGRTGGRAFRANLANTAGTGQPLVACVRYLMAPTTSVIFGAAWRVSHDVPGDLLRVQEGSTTHVTVRVTSLRVLEVVAAGVVVATQAEWYPQQWQHLAMEVTIGDAVGALRVLLNGEEICNLTGIDTRAGGTGVLDRIMWQAPPTPRGGGANWVDVDDMVIQDSTGPAPYNTSVGDCRVETLRPNGNGSHSEWMGSDANSVDNWQLVDDNATTTDYVETDVIGARDLYQLTDPTGLDLGEVLAVQVEALLAKSDAGDPPGDLLAVTRSAAGVEATGLAATPADVSTAWQWRAAPIMVTDPAGDPWTIERLTNLQAGVGIAPLS